MTTTTTGQVPPLLYDTAAERAVLGSMLVNEGSIPIVSAILQADDYFLPTHRVIHTTIMELVAQGKIADTVTVGSRCDRDYISALVDSTPTATNVRAYAATVKDLSLLRRLRDVGNDIAGKASRRPPDVRNLIDEAERMVLSVSPPAEAESMTDISSVVADIATELDKKVPAKSWKTGFEAIDSKLGGLHPQSFIVIGARPGIGKTGWALNIARTVSLQGTVLFFSLEMSAQELGERLICALAGIRFADLRSRCVSDEKLADVYRAAADAEKMDLKIVWDPHTTLASVKSIARRQKAKQDLALIVIDYLQMMHSGGHEDTRWQEVSTISRELKVLARELEVPVLALSQLNREVESHWESGKPKLSQLRESGAIEQDADAVLLLSWPKDRQGVVVVDVAKNRHGPLGEVEMTWEPQYMRFH